MGIAITKMLATSVNYEIAKPMLINLLRTNPRRAEAMCKTVEGSFFDAIGAAIATSAMCQTQDPNIIVQANRPAYDAISQAVVVKWGQLIGKGKLAAGLAVGGLALAISK